VIAENISSDCEAGGMIAGFVVSGLANSEWVVAAGDCAYSLRAIRRPPLDHQDSFDVLTSISNDHALRFCLCRKTKASTIPSISIN
jgi:hypothetical protein